MKTLFLLALLGLASVAFGDAQFCILQIGSGIVPQSRSEKRWCVKHDSQLLRHLRKLCTRYPGTSICVRAVQTGIGGTPGNDCSPPLPTVLECCAAGISVIFNGNEDVCPAACANPCPNGAP